MGNTNSNQRHPDDPTTDSPRRRQRTHSEKGSPARHSTSTPRTSTATRRAGSVDKDRARTGSSGAAASRSASTSGGSGAGTGGPGQPPHHSLRTKKRSLELPDLAALALSPSALAATHTPSLAAHAPYSPGRFRPSEPIPIPASARTPAERSPSPGPRGATALSDDGVTAVLLDQPPSTHIPIPPTPGTGRGGGRVPNPHTRGALAQHNNSTRSFIQQQQQQREPRTRTRSPGPGAGHAMREDPQARGVVGEEVRSSIPLGLLGAEDARVPERGRGRRKREEVPEVKDVLITWHGGGKSVVLARAGDDNWEGRQPMDYDETTGTWTTWVSLLPGTHHIKFIVDEIWRLDEQLPTAVDDDGSLANYVAVPLSGSTVASDPVYDATNGVAITSLAEATAANTAVNAGAAPVITATNVTMSTSNGGQTLIAVPSLWSEVESSDGSDGDWTDELPRQLINAAREEEIYLAHGVHTDRPAPDIPPAPLLPRYLDKLILNARPVGVSHARDTSASRHGRDTTGGFGSTAGSSRGGVGRMRSVMGTMGPSTRGRSGLGMTSSTASDLSNNDPSGSNAVQASPVIPVTTASGTDVTIMAMGVPSRGIGERVSPSPYAYGTPPGRGIRMGSATNVSLAHIGMADDGSVLPVPSHVVLQHLATSAIRHGVLAVGNSIRYKKKFITVVYYKPI